MNPKLLASAALVASLALAACDPGGQAKTDTASTPITDPSKDTGSGVGPTNTGGLGADASATAPDPSGGTAPAVTTGPVPEGPVNAQVPGQPPGPTSNGDMAPK